MYLSWKHPSQQFKPSVFNIRIKANKKFKKSGKRKISSDNLAGLSFDLAPPPGKMMFVGGSKSREGRRKGDQDQESAKFTRFPFPRPKAPMPPSSQCLLPSLRLRWQFLGLLTLPSRQIEEIGLPSLQSDGPDRIAGRQSNLGDREKFPRLGETAAVQCWKWYREWHSAFSKRKA